MKRLIAAGIIILVMSVTFGCGRTVVCGLCRESEDLLAQAQAAFHKGHPEIAEKQVDRAAELWQERRTKWVIFLNRTKAEEISERLQILADSADRETFPAECRALQNRVAAVKKEWQCSAESFF